MIELAYNDNVYAWILLNSHYNPLEKHNYIYKEEINFSKIAQDIHRARQTVSKRFNKLVEDRFILEYKYNGKKCYKIPYYQDFEELDGETVMQLLCLPFEKQREEIIKTYAFLLKRKRISVQEKKSSFLCSNRDILEAFGHSTGGGKNYENIKGILTILQGAGIIKFRTLLPQQKSTGVWVGPQLEIYEVNKRASDEWLGVK